MIVTADDGPLVGRVRELRALQEAYEDACRGHGGVQLIIGEPGVGKTRLAAALADHARDEGAVVIWTRGWGQGAPAYWPWAQVVRGLRAGVDGAQMNGALGSGAERLARLAPEVAGPPPGRPVGDDEDSEIARFLLFDALVSLLRLRSTMTPVVVLIDDLQAVDEGSLAALDIVSRMLGDARALIVATMHERILGRSREAEQALRNIERAARRVLLGGLRPDDTARFIESSSGVSVGPRLMRALHAATEGNPFFTREIVALLRAEGRLQDPPDELPLPDGVLETIRRRLEPLSPAAVEVLGLAAIVGRRFSLTALEHATQHDRDVVQAALDAALELGLLVAVPGRLGDYRFGHGLVGETLIAGMTSTEKMAAHRDVGVALEHVYRGAVEQHLAELAHHFLSAGSRGDVARAVDYAERAAEQALDALAFEQAAELYARALAALHLLEPDVRRRAGLLLGLGTAQSRAGRPAARDSFEAAVVAARSIGADDVFARAVLGLAPFALTPGIIDKAHVELLGEALERIGPADDPLRVRLLGSLAVALYWSHSERRRAALAGEALEMARRLGDEPTLAIALSSAQLATTGPDMTEQGLRWLEELFEISARAGESVMSLAARSRHVDLLLELDDLANADIAIETLARLAGELRDPRAAALAPLQRARRAALEGRFADARDLVAGVEAIQHELSGSTIPLTVASTKVVLAWLQEGPLAMLDTVQRWAAGTPAMPAWRAGLAAALAAAGRRDEAQREFERLAADDFAALPRDNLWLGAMTLLAETVVTLELGDRAMELHAQLAPLSGRNAVLPTSAFVGPIEMWLGILARVAGRPAQALEHLAAARARATLDGARAILVRIAIEEAEALLDGGGAAARARAGELIDQAALQAAQMDLTAHVERVAALRARLATRPAASAGAPVATLRRIGDIWTIELGGRSAQVRDARGVRLLAELLARPGEEIHSLTLVAAIDGGAAGGARPVSSGGPETEGRFGLQGDAGPALDAQAKRAYRARIAELAAQLAEARARRDEARVRALREELDFLNGELRRGLGKGGRDRASGSHAERARVNVTRAIRTTMKRIADSDEVIGAELEAGVRTGTFCMYAPDRERPLRWRVEG